MYLPLYGLKLPTIEQILSEHDNHSDLMAFSSGGAHGYTFQRLLLAKNDLTIIEDYDDCSDLNNRTKISEADKLEIYPEYFHRFIEEYQYGKSWGFACRRPRYITFYFEGKIKQFYFLWTADEINLMQKRYRCMLTVLEMLLGEPIIPYNDVK
jgi:hypothetical protein